VSVNSATGDYSKRLYTEQTNRQLRPGVKGGFEQVKRLSGHLDTYSLISREGHLQRSDIRAVGDLAGEASSVLTTLVRGMHAGIAGRVFDSIGAVLAAVNGIYGDELTAHENPLAGAMVVRHGGKSMALTTDDLAAAYPAATGRVVVFVHG
jgi:hypothetical protein